MSERLRRAQRSAVNRELSRRGHPTLGPKPTVDLAVERLTRDLGMADHEARALMEAAK